MRIGNTNFLFINYWKNTAFNYFPWIEITTLRYLRYFSIRFGLLGFCLLIERETE